MNCPQCDREIVGEEAFCSGCGTPLRSHCPGCGHTGETGARFCARCGQALAAESGHTPASGRILSGERREATVLFSDLTGYTALNERLDPEEVAHILGEIKDAATRSIGAHGGTVNQFVGDEVMALFGIPVSHDDDARRAVAAGLELHASVRELAERFDSLTEPLRMHTGVNTGLVVAQLRDTRDGVFAATGDSVNTAARLLSAAGPDELFVGPETLERISPYFETESVGALKLKGKAESLQVHKVIGTTGIRSRFAIAARRGLSPLTGRSKEWAALERARVGARKEARFAHLVGESGIGKSRLAHEFCRHAEAEGVRLLRGSCQASGRVVPYLPFIEAIRDFLGIRPQDGPEEIAARVAGASDVLGSQTGVHVPVYLQLLSVDSEAHSSRPTVTPEELPRAIRDAMVASLQGVAARGPVLLHLEDWHWADEASAGLLPLLGRGLCEHPILVLVDHRPTAEPKWLDLEAERIELAPFGADSTRDLVASCLGAPEVQCDLLGLIRERTGGNPFFIEEVCASLRQQGLLVQRGGEIAASGRIEEIEIPDTVQAVLRSRIDLLEPASRDVLRIASVVGRDVPFRVLERLTPAGRALTSHVDQLERFEFVQPRRKGPAADFLFRHATVQEVAYETLLRRERSELHQRVGEVIEELHAPGRLGEHVEALAHHYRLAGNEEKALVFLEQAAWKAAGTYAFAQAREQFGWAIEILQNRDEEDDDSARRRIDLTMRWAEVNLFDPSIEQVERLEAARDRAIALGDPERIVTSLYWIGWIYYAVGEQKQAIELLEQVVEMVRPAGDDAILGMMMLALGHSYAVARDPRAAALLEEGLERRSIASEGSGGVEDAHVMDSAGALDSFSQCQLALVDSYQDQAVRSRERFRDAIVRVRKTGSISTESSNWITFGLASVVLGDWDVAIEAAQEARRIAEHVRAHYHLDTSDGLEGYARFQLGERREGRLLLQRGVERLEKSSALLSMSLTLATYADVLAELGESQEARFRAESALERHAHGDRLGEDLAQRVLFRLDARAGNAGPADARRAKLLEHARAHGCRRELALAKLELARASDDSAERAELRAQSLESFEALELPGFAELVHSLP